MGGLSGKRVAILEARRSAELGNLLRFRGAEVYVAPAVREAPVEDPVDIDRFIEELAGGAFDFVFLLTGAGVKALFDRAEQIGRFEAIRTALQELTLVARGPKPVSVLRAAGIRPSAVTSSPHTTASLLEIARALDLTGRAVGLVLHGGPSPEIIEGIEALGGRVRPVQVYRLTLPEDERPIQDLIDRLEAGTIDAIAFTSASQVQNLFAVAERFDQSERLYRQLARLETIAAVGPVCAAAILEQGLPVHVEPAEPKMGPMVLEIDRYFSQVEHRTPLARSRLA